MWSFLGNLFLVHLPNNFVASFKETAKLIFEELIFNVKSSVVRLLLNFDGVEVSTKQNPKTTTPNLPSDNKDRKDFGKIGRNDPCHCGSGKKYKKCAMVNLCSKN